MKKIMVNNDTLIEVKNLDVSYKVYEGKLKVLDGINFYINFGERVGLVGETGCGKSTLLKAILRILKTPPAVIKGEILFEGKEDILRMDSSRLFEIRKKYLSLIFQDSIAALNPVFTIGTLLYDVIKYQYKENRSFNPKKRKEEIKKKQIQVLKSVLLSDPERVIKNYPMQLSGGMCQRVLIAMALLCNASLLIADEPTTALDVTVSDQILRLIGNLVKNKGVAFFLISHNLGIVRTMTDRIYVMYAGNIVETAPTKIFFGNPLHPYSQGLMNAIPKLSGEKMGKGIKGYITDYVDIPSGCRFYPRCSYATKICKVKRPPLFKVDSNHKVACFLYQLSSVGK